MRKIIFPFLLLFIFSITNAQNCDELYVDISKGTFNGLSPAATQDEVKKQLPCFTGETIDGAITNCGGGVFFSKHNFYFYTGKDNINIRKGFTGKCSVELFDKTEDEVTKLFGRPEGKIKDDEGVLYVFYKRLYGCIVIKVKEGKTEEFFMFTKPPEEIDLCV